MEDPRADAQAPRADAQARETTVFAPDHNTMMRNDATYAYAAVTGNDYEPPLVAEKAAGTVAPDTVPVRIHSLDGSGPFGQQAGDVVRSNVKDLEYSWDSSRFDTVFKRLEKKLRGRIKCVDTDCMSQRLTKCHWTKCPDHACILHVKASNLLKGGRSSNIEWVCQKHKVALNQRDMERAHAHYKGNLGRVIAVREADPEMMMEEDWV